MKKTGKLVRSKLEAKRDWMGTMRGTATIVGDIVGPTDRFVEWEAARPAKMPNR